MPDTTLRGIDFMLNLTNTCLSAPIKQPILQALIFRFAELAATAMILNGIKVHLFSSITATPFVPYCVLR